MLGFTWFTAKKEKDKVIGTEKIGELFISERFSDGKPRLILKDVKANEEFLLSGEITKIGEGDNAELKVDIVFEKITK